MSEDHFHAQTGVGWRAMDDIVANVFGRCSNIVLLLSHYDTLRLAVVVGADDDHMPFIRRGVAAAGVIDFDYPYWHTTEDKLDKCSPHSLAIVGHVFLATIQSLDKKLAPA